MRVIGAIEPSLRRVEMERVKRQRPENLDAYDLVLRSLPFVYAQMPKDSAIAIPLLEEALKLDPSYGAAHALFELLPSRSLGARRLASEGSNLCHPACSRGNCLEQ